MIVGPDPISASNVAVVSGPQHYADAQAVVGARDLGEIELGVGLYEADDDPADERPRYGCHPAQHGCSQRSEQQPGAQPSGGAGRPRGDPGNRHLEHIGDTGAGRRDDPHQRRQVLRVDAEQRGAVVVLGRAPDRDADSFIEYNTDLFEAATIKRMAGHFEQLLESVMAQPQQRVNELLMLTAREQQQLLVEWNQTESGYSELCLREMFEQQVARSPEAIALVYEAVDKLAVRSPLPLGEGGRRPGEGSHAI